MIKRRRYTADEYKEGIVKGDISLLSQAITLIESKRNDDRKVAAELLNLIIEHTGNSIRIGITGVPGVGKSTFIESFGSYLTSKGNRVAILAIDPTSQRTHGSILGDKTRMEKLSLDPNAYIRPTAAGNTLGGVASTTREAMMLCEAAGFNIIIIETVGVGQSETLVRDMVDFFLLLMLAGAGDELQGIKRGIMEMADALVINKADGDNLKTAKRARAEYQTALHYMPLAQHGWQPKVLTCSALENEGIPEVSNLIEKYKDHITLNGWLKCNRAAQNLKWFHEKINFLIKERYYSDVNFNKMLKDFEEQVRDNQISPSSAAQKLLSTI